MFLISRRRGFLAADSASGRPLVAGLANRLAAIGQHDVDLHAQALGQPLGARLAVEVHAAGGAVQRELHLLVGQILGLQRAQEAQAVLRRAHVHLHHREEGLGHLEHGVEPVDQRLRHVDDDEIIGGLRRLDQLGDVLGRDDVQRQRVHRRGQHRQPRLVGGQRRGQRVVVDALGVGDQVVDRLAPGQVQIGRDRSVLEVEIQDADALVGLLGQERQLPRKVHREGGRADPAGDGVDRDHQPVALARAALGRGRVLLHHRAELHDGLRQLALGHRVDEEIVGARLLQLAQRQRRDVLLDDQQHLQPVVARRLHHAHRAGQVGLVPRGDGDDRQLQVGGDTGPDRGLAVLHRHGRPATGKFLVEIGAQVRKVVHAARDGVDLDFFALDLQQAHAGTSVPLPRRPAPGSFAPAGDSSRRAPRRDKTCRINNTIFHITDTPLKP